MSCAVCPAADQLDGPPIGGPIVICRVMTEEQRQADPILEGAIVGQVISSEKDPSVFHNFCNGEALPMVRKDEGARAHHTFCPVWISNREREWTEKRQGERTFGPVERPKILGVDPEPMAEILGKDPEEVPVKVPATKTLTGHDAAEDIVENWKEPEAA